ncbi:hypothetical protein [Streptomyces sp. NPDC089795]|uniref:hypothetical protein n=1 Tax=Streptomyces sp. NPDC089795 TaxID=3155297 RepID=UPI003420DF85
MHPHPHPDTTPVLVVHPPPPLDTERRALLSTSPPDDAPWPRRRPAGQGGRTLRITHSYTYRVTDEGTLLHAAADRGWRPSPPSERPDDEPHDLIGAVMVLTGRPDVAGTRTLEHQARAELLDPGTEGEPAHAVAERLGGSIRTPDFATLFTRGDRPFPGGHDHLEEHRRWLTPRTADLLHTALVVLADQAYDDARHLGDRFLPDAGPAASEVLERLPPFTWRADRRWRRRMARAFDDLADDLARGHRPTPACTAEEQALRLAVEDVPGHLEDLREGDDHHTLPRHADDYDYSQVLPPDSRSAFKSAGEPRRPAAWFTTFDDCHARDPHRGFRR